MKIRCKNCYKVLKPQEEYCTFCGTHSEEIARAMKTGYYGPNTKQRLGLAGLLFFILAFLGNGIAMVILGMITKDSSQSLFNAGNAILISSIITGITFILVNIKDLKNMIWNGTKVQLYGALLIGVLFVIIGVLLAMLSKYTCVLPKYIQDYLTANPKFFEKGYSIIKIIITFTFIIITEEIFYRRIFIDFIDENTLFSDGLVILVGALFGTALHFAWLMSFESLIVTFLTNALMSAMYIYTNRSILVNIITRLLLLFSVIIILVF